MIELLNITKRYGGPDAPFVLKGVDMRIESGDFIALMGASGSGKTTLMNIIGLLDLPTSGVYRMNDRDVSALDDRALSRLRNRSVGFIFQSFYLIPYLSVLDNVMLPRFYSGASLRSAEKLAMELLSHFGMEEKAAAKPGQLSGGQQQRVAIARSLINSPALILADEPTGQLDSTTSETIMRYISALPETGTSVLLVTHDTFTASFAKKIIKIKDGLLEK